MKREWKGIDVRTFNSIVDLLSMHSAASSIAYPLFQFYSRSSYEHEDVSLRWLDSTFNSIVDLHSCDSYSHNYHVERKLSIL